MREAIRSKKKVYPVGKRHAYVYYLVQGIEDEARRGAKVARLTTEYDLTAEEQEGLARLLADLDARRAEPKPQRQYRPFRRERLSEEQEELRHKAGDLWDDL